MKRREFLTTAAAGLSVARAGSKALTAGMGRIIAADISEVDNHETLRFNMARILGKRRSA